MVPVLDLDGDACPSSEIAVPGRDCHRSLIRRDIQCYLPKKERAEELARVVKQAIGGYLPSTKRD
jgi:hypothetical protein